MSKVERPAPTEASFLTIDPHGRYVAVGSRLGAVNFLNRFGRPAGRLETIQPIAHLCFLADRPFLIGAAAFGMLVGVEVLASRGSGRLEPEIAWQDRLMSNVGRLTVSGDGAMILASCFTHGIQRFDLRGRNEGSYHLGGTVSHAVPGLPGPDDRRGDARGGAGDHELGGQRAVADPAAPAGDRARGRPAGPVRDLRPLDRRDRPTRPVRPGPGPSGCGSPACGLGARDGSAGRAGRVGVRGPRPARSGDPTGRCPPFSPKSRPRRPSWPSRRIPPAWRSSPAPIGCSSTRRRGRSSARGRT